jgi:lipooligosaccharide transport system permease protein
MARPIAVRVLEGHARAYRHTWRGTTVSAVVSPVLFLTAMGLGLGGLVDAGGEPGVDTLLGEVGYLVWLAPGLLAASAMQNGAADGSFPVVAGMRWVKTYHAALNTPVRPRDLLVGQLGWAALRATVAGAAFVVVAAFYGALSFGRGMLALVPALVTALGTCAAVAAFCATRETDQALSGLFRFVVIPSFLFSGAFFPVEQLPDAVRPVVQVLPVWHGVELTRAVALGVDPAAPWPVHVAALVGFLVVATALAMWSFDRQLRR